MYRVFITAKRREFVSDYQERGPSLNLSWHFFLFSFSFLLLSSWRNKGYCLCMICTSTSSICKLFMCAAHRMGSCPVPLHGVSNSAWGKISLCLQADIWHIEGVHRSHAHDMPGSLQMHTVCAIVCVISSSPHVLGGVSHMGSQAAHSGYQLLFRCSSKHWPSSVYFPSV